MISTEEAKELLRDRLKRRAPLEVTVWRPRNPKANPDYALARELGRPDEEAAHLLEVLYDLEQNDPFVTVQRHELQKQTYGTSEPVEYTQTLLTATIRR